MKKATRFSLVGFFNLFIVSAFPLIAGATSIPSAEVTHLTSASFSDRGPYSFTVGYQSGGCSVPKTDYKLELVSLEHTGAESETATLRIRVFQTVHGNCRMAIFVKNTVNLAALVEEQAASIGLPLPKNSSHVITLKFIAPAVEGYLSTTEENLANMAKKKN